MNPAMSQTYRHHGDRIVGVIRRTTDSNIDTLSGLSRKQFNRDVESLPPLGHRESIFGDGTQCGCKACQQRHKTQDHRIRSLHDLNQRNREVYGR